MDATMMFQLPGYGHDEAGSSPPGGYPPFG